MWYYYVGIPVFFLIVCMIRSSRKRFPVEGKSVLVTGGSTGIGLEIARECVRKGAKSVCIAARREESLVTAKEDIMKDIKNSYTEVSYVVLDCCSFEHVKESIEGLTRRSGPIDICFANVGYCKPGVFADASVDDFVDQYTTNVLSGVTIAKHVLPLMTENPNGGVFMFTSSMAGQAGLYGFGAYTATKFGIRGLAETLAMEYAPHNVHVGVIFPPATQTPGFDEEQKTKPAATFEMENGESAWSPRDVAVRAVSATERAEYRVSFGVDGYILSWLTAGFGPVSGPLSFLMEALLAGPLRLVASCVLFKYNRIAKHAIMQHDHAHVMQGGEEGRPLLTEGELRSRAQGRDWSEPLLAAH